MHLSFVYKALFFVLFVLGLVLDSAKAYTPLGATVPDKCKDGSILKKDGGVPRKYQCPSHYICVRGYNSLDEEFGKCRCARFYGFYGPDCSKLSVASYVSLSVYIVVGMMGILSLLYNSSLLRLLHVYDKLTVGTLVTLSLNLIAPIQSIFFSLSYALTIFEVDKNMVLRSYRISIVVIAYFVNMIAALQISTTWIRLTLRVSRQNKPHYSRLKTAGMCCFIFGIISLGFIYLGTRAFVLVILNTSPVLIGSSYWYGGGKVVKALRSMFKPGQRLSPSMKNSLELAYAVEDTAKRIIHYCVVTFLLSASFQCTQQGFNPYYSHQNNLPRWFQGQISILMFISYMGLSLQVSMYFHFICLRHEMKHVPLKLSNTDSLFSTLWNMHIPRIVKDLTMDDLELTALDSEMLESSPPVNTPEVKDKLSPPHWPDMSAGVALVSVDKTSFQTHIVNKGQRNSNKTSSMGSSQLESITEPPEVSPRLVKETPQLHLHQPQEIELFGTSLSSSFKVKPDLSSFKHKLEHRSSSTLTSSSTSSLASGSHAFVRCLRDGSHIVRCSDTSFKFGCVAQEEYGKLRAGHTNEVVMSGELEVNEEGVLTRWLNKGDMNWYSIEQSALPFELAWVHMSAKQVLALDPAKRQALEEQDCLLELSHQVRSKGDGGGDYIIKADSMWQPSVSRSTYDEAKMKINSFREKVKAVLDMNRVQPMSERETIRMAVEHHVQHNSGVNSGDTHQLDPEADAYFKGEKMRFDMREDEQAERQHVIDTINEMRRQMREAGVFDVHRQGAEERRRFKESMVGNSNNPLGDNKRHGDEFHGNVSDISDLTD